MGYIEKTDYLKESKDILKDALIDLGADIDSDTPFKQYVNSIDNIYNDFPKTPYQEGTNITLTNCSLGKIDFENNIVGYGNISQESIPTPDTPIPIQVVTGTQKVIVRGKNIFDGDIELGTFSSGDNVNSTTFYRSKNYIKVMPNTNYAFSNNGIARRLVINFYTDEKVWIDYSDNRAGTINYTGKFTTPNNCYYIKFRSFTDDFNIWENENLQLEERNYYDNLWTICSTNNTNNTFR